MFIFLRYLENITKLIYKQIKEGNWWYAIPCREATPGLPAITIDSPNGKSYVCHKLATSQKEAK